MHKQAGVQNRWLSPIVPDNLGSTRELWSQAKLNVGNIDYTPWGDSYADSSQGITRRYTSHEYDMAVGAHFAPYRYYMSDTSRWMIHDPAGTVDGLNLFAYVSNSPVQRHDPTGLFGALDPDIDSGGGPGNCGIHTCIRPLQGWKSALFYLQGGFYHEYIQFGDENTDPTEGDNLFNPGPGGPYVNDPWPRGPSRECIPTRRLYTGTLDGNKSCATATCADITACIKGTPNTGYGTLNNNCQHYVSRALSNCCLERGGGYSQLTNSSNGPMF